MTRRRLLTAGGAVALGGLAGCSALQDLLDSASERVVTNRTASPAGFYTGADSVDAGDQTDLHRSEAVDVRYVPPTLQADSRRIDLEGWSTTSSTKAQDYNSSRSNKPTSIWVPDLDDDGDGIDDVAVLVGVLDTERALLVHADAGLAAIDSRSTDSAAASLDAFINATTKVRSDLEGCPSEVCVTVRENADARKGLAQDARDSVDAGEWDSARRSMQRARRIVQGDIDRIHDDLDSDDDGILDATEPLYDYLDGEPTVAERFVVSLPDARVSGGETALAEELTPQRVLDYFVGERDAEGCGESDRTVRVHRDLGCRELMSATLAKVRRENRGVAAFESDGGVLVTGATPDAGVAEPRLFVAADGSATAPETLDSWGDERSRDDAAVTPTLVCPVAATPPDSPAPMPALFYVRRVRHEDQLLFAGGWVLDDGALYEDTATLLVADGPNVVAGVTRSDIDAGRTDLRSRVGGRRRPGRTTYATITLSAPYDPNAEYLPVGARPACPADGDPYCWGVQSREALAGGGDCDDTGGEVTPHCVVSALDAPILHLVGAAESSNDVKFKAGAELSKAVN